MPGAGSAWSARPQTCRGPGPLTNQGWLTLLPPDGDPWGGCANWVGFVGLGVELAVVAPGIVVDPPLTEKCPKKGVPWNGTVGGGKSPQ